MCPVFRKNKKERNDSTKSNRVTVHRTSGPYVFSFGERTNSLIFLSALSQVFIFSIIREEVPTLPPPSTPKDGAVYDSNKPYPEAKTMKKA